MSGVRASVHAKWIVGKVIGTNMTKTAKVRVTRMVLDNYLLKVGFMSEVQGRFTKFAGDVGKGQKGTFALAKYFSKRKTYFAHDAQQQCTVGDIVLLKALPERRTKHVKHELAEIIFKVGRVVDPLTGKMCAGTTFLESLEDIDVNDLDKRLQNIHLPAAPSSQLEKKADS